jgi:hypothetical protein
MKKSRFTEEQIAYALRLADSGSAVVDVCRQIGGGDGRFRWHQPIQGNEKGMHVALLYDTMERCAWRASKLSV